MNIQVKGLAELQSGAEVLENRKVVLSRIRAWKPKPRIVEIVEEVEQETAILIQQIAPPPVPAADVNSVESRADSHTDVAEPPPPRRYPTIASIIKAVCVRYNVNKIDLISARRTKDVVLPRQVGMTLARNLTLHGLPSIGRHFGGRDHTTVLFAVRKITALRADDSKFNAEIVELEQQLSA